MGSSRISMPKAIPRRLSRETRLPLKVALHHAFTCARSNYRAPPLRFAGQASMKSVCLTRQCARRKIATFGFELRCDTKSRSSPRCSPTTGFLRVPCRLTRSVCSRRNCNLFESITDPRAAVLCHARERGLERTSNAQRLLIDNTCAGLH